ncbi:MAG TPA: TetR/AcrR family transcriptional regulator [Actinomycetota bacterium]|nr:TetR/AcrR family transcriptional regulator [Actinomycetota bacterium]
MAKDSGTGPRRHTRAESRAATRARLVQAAAEVLAERGYHGAAVEEITARAGFSRGAYYANFQSKQDLFLAVLDAQVGTKLQALQGAVAAEASSPGTLGFYLHEESARRSAERRTWALLWSELYVHAVRNPEFAPRLAGYQRAVKAAIAQAIQAHAEQMSSSLPAPAEHLAAVLMALDDGFLIQEVLDPGSVPAHLRAQVNALLFIALAAPASKAQRPDEDKPSGC